MLVWSKSVFFGLLLLASSHVAAHGESWQQHQSAGFQAFDTRDYAGAMERFQLALVVAHEQEAAPAALGSLLENLAATYLAAGKPRNALAAILRWDRLLMEWGTEPWAQRQAVVRDRLTAALVDVMARLESQAEPEARAAAAAAVSARSGPYALHLESTKTEGNIESAWTELQADYPLQLADKGLLVKEVEVEDQGTFYRILGTSFADSADAKRVCRELRDQGQYCAVLRLD